MRYQILGPLEVYNGSGQVALPARQLRVVLALLVAEAGQAVSTDRLVNEVWPTTPPRSAVRTMQGYVFRLRRVLGGGPGGPLGSTNNGYRLVTDDGEVDSLSFIRLTGAGRLSAAAGRLSEAEGYLGRALALWRGSALQDVQPGPELSLHADDLNLRHIDVAEQWLAILLVLNRHTEAAEVAGPLVRRHPFREPLWERYLIALNRCGRRADALAAYRTARNLLVTELGIEPGQRLRELHHAILCDTDPDAIRIEVNAVGLDRTSSRDADLVGSRHGQPVVS